MRHPYRQGRVALRPRFPPAASEGIKTPRVHHSAMVGMQQPGPVWGNSMTRAIIAIIGLLALGGCAADKTSTELPAMYINMADPGAHLDEQVAASMISQYRQNNGLGAVVIDPDLMRLAESQSQGMSAKNKLDPDVRAPLPQRLSAPG